MITLRPDQSEVLDRTRLAYKKNKAVLLRAPTGWGKTVIASHVCQSALNRRRRVIFSTPRIEINAQAERTFAGMDVLIACKQTIIRRDWPCDLLIDDESHYGLTDPWANKLNSYVLAGGWVLGLTATPIAGMDRVYKDVVHGPSMEWLMDHGHLSRYRAYGPSEPDLIGVPVVAGDYAKSPLEEIMQKPSVTGSAVESWLKFAKGKRTIGFCVSRKLSKQTVAEFVAVGIRAEHIDGETPPAERRAIIERFASRETEWLGCVDLLIMGFDLSSQIGREVPIEAIQDLAPTRKLQKHLQKLGRALRKKDEPAIILDNAGNLRRLGFPDDDFEWSIATGIRRKSAEAAIAVSVCHVCYAAYRTAPACPYCHAERKLTPREVEIREGELAEIEREAFAKRKRIDTAIATRSDTPIVALAKVAKANGYAAGWIVKRLDIKKIPYNRGTVWKEIARVMNES